MKWYSDEIKLVTDKKYQLVDITTKVKEKVYPSEVENGLCVVSVPHATAGLIVNENEAGVKEDILNRIQALAPDNISYQHNRIDNNAQAHVISSIIGTDKTFIIENGEMVRGTWQNIFFVELDGPHAKRRVVVKIFGE